MKEDTTKVIYTILQIGLIIFFIVGWYYAIKNGVSK